jgi:hypothetical protein
MINWKHSQLGHWWLCFFSVSPYKCRNRTEIGPWPLPSVSSPNLIHNSRKEWLNIVNMLCLISMGTSSSRCSVYASCPIGLPRWIVWFCLHRSAVRCNTWQYTRLVPAHAYFEKRCAATHCGYHQFVYILCTLYILINLLGLFEVVTYILMKYEFQQCKGTYKNTLKIYETVSLNKHQSKLYHSNHVYNFIFSLNKVNINNA